VTTSAPQWPGQEGIHEPRGEDRHPRGRQAVPPPPLRELPARVSRAGPPPAQERQPAGGWRAPLRAVPDTTLRRQPEAPSEASPPPPRVAPRRSVGRRGPLLVVRDPKEWERRRARAKLPSPAAVTRDIALALLEVEAGCRSAAQLERVVSPQLWEVLERCIGRRGGPLPSGRSVMSVHCQEHTPGLADTMAVVRKGDLVRPIALRLDAGGGRWVVTELRWWRNETDTATTPGRDGGSS
jgi:hypothetical protein